MVFSDESRYNTSEQFKSIGVVSGTRANTELLNEQIKKVLLDHNKEEVKFSKLNGDSNTRNCVNSIIELTLSFCINNKIKIGVLTWDVRDSRHAIIGRNDIENLKRMYFHKWGSVLKIWGDAEKFFLYPDQFSAIDWNEINFYLKSKDFQKAQLQESLFKNFKGCRFKICENVTELCSKRFPIIQAADIFAGMIRYSHKHGAELISWIEQSKQRNSLFKDEISIQQFTRKQIGTFEVMAHFNDICKKHRLQVSLYKAKYFQTYSWNKLNFWFYKSQGEYDKAPVKNSIRKH